MSTRVHTRTAQRTGSRTSDTNTSFTLSSQSERTSSLDTVDAAEGVFVFLTSSSAVQQGTDV